MRLTEKWRDEMPVDKQEEVTHSCPRSSSPATATTWRQWPEVRQAHRLTLRASPDQPRCRNSAPTPRDVVEFLGLVEARPERGMLGIPAIALAECGEAGIEVAGEHPGRAEFAGSDPQTPDHRRATPRRGHRRRPRIDHCGVRRSDAAPSRSTGLSIGSVASPQRTPRVRIGWNQDITPGVDRNGMDPQRLGDLDQFIG